MKYTSYIVVALIIALLIGCSPDKRISDAAKKAAITIGASNCSVSRTRSISTDIGMHNTIELNFNDEKLKNKDKSKFASIAAFVFYKNTNPKEDRYDRIEVIMEDDSTDTKLTYTTGELSEVDDLIVNPVMKFFSTYKSDSIRYLFDAQNIDDLALMEIHYRMNYNDSVYGKLVVSTFNGFEEGVVDDTQEPIVIIKYSVKNGVVYKTYAFRVDANTGKIFDIGVPKL